MKKVIITIDTEGHDGMDPVSKLIWGKTKQGLFGIDRIMDICDTYNAKVLFFVDIAEAWDYGEDKIAEVIKHIEKRGHNVGVHIHPDHVADKKRLFLWEYSREEQKAIIVRCTELYKKITGRYPQAFRAGKYGANIETLDILDELGYEFDFSQFHGQKWCGINPPVTINTPCKYKNIIEIPVTVYESISIGKFIRIDKVDAVMNSSEFKYVMNKAKKLTDNIIISLFYHSFSMLNWRENPDEVSFNKKEEQKFIKTLEYIENSETYEFISFSELIEDKDKLNVSKQTDNFIVRIKNPFISFWFTFLKACGIRKFNKKAKFLVNIVIFACLALVALIIIKIIISIFL